MSLDVLKSETDTVVGELYAVMAEIQALDKYIEESEDPDAASLLVEVILQKAQTFDYLTEVARRTIQKYLDAQKASGVPVDFSYSRLYSQIVKA